METKKALIFFNLALIIFLIIPGIAKAEYVLLQTVSITTDASGDDTEFTGVVTGCVSAVRYVPDGTSPLATGADLDITGEITGIVVSNQDNIGTSAFTVAPRQATHGVDGTAALYAAAGTAVNTPVCVANERLKVVIAQGGDTKSGVFYILID